MTRREFTAALGGLAGLPCCASEPVILTAIAGVRLPQTLAITGASSERMRKGLWELRTYRTTLPALANRFDEVFPRAGIHPLLRKTEGPDLTYLIPFENLTARERAWTALNADPEWIRLRHQFRSYRFGLYRAGIEAGSVS